MAASPNSWKRKRKPKIRVKESSSKLGVRIGRGHRCPKCGHHMERKQRKGPPANPQAYWFSEWDYCRGCRHVQHYEEFKQHPWVPAEFQFDTWEKPSAPRACARMPTRRGKVTHNEE